MAKDKITKPPKQKVNARSERARIGRENVKRMAKLLKDQGVAFEGTDFRSAKVTSYMRKRVRELASVLTGEGTVIRGTRAEVRALKTDPELLASGRDFLVARNEPGTVQAIRSGMRSIVQPLRNDQTIERLVVPGGTSVHNVLRFLESGGADKIKMKDEWFAFRFEDYASPRVFPDAKALYEFLSRYIEDEDESDGTPPRVYLYRVFPPNDWYYLVKQETLDRQAELSEYAKGMKGRELRRIRFAIQRTKDKLGKLPRRITQTTNEKRAAFLEKERQRNRKRQSGEDYKRYARERKAAQRKAKKDQQ